MFILRKRLPPILFRWFPHCMYKVVASRLFVEELATYLLKPC